MTVYLLTHGCDYGGSNPIGVFATMESAIAVARNLQKNEQRAEPWALDDDTSYLPWVWAEWSGYEFLAVWRFEVEA